MLLPPLDWADAEPALIGCNGPWIEVRNAKFIRQYLRIDQSIVADVRSEALALVGSRKQVDGGFGALPVDGHDPHPRLSVSAK